MRLGLLVFLGINAALLVVLLVVILIAPAYSTFAFWAALAWLLSSLFLRRSTGVGRPAGTSGPLGSTPTGSSTALGSASANRPTVGAEGLGFCVYCGTNLAAGELECPSCHRLVPSP
jgi:hypothetical protein